MQDRFKFRHWDSEINEMRYGDIQLGFDGKPFVIGRNGPSEIPKVYDIDNVITLQCTGLKDKNGKLIFEGDIVKNYRNTIYKIVFEEKSCGFLLYEPTEHEYYYPCYNCDQFKNRNICNMEVIGNVYENSELLTEVQK